jgi:energy-converting hydrogenase Eha subunit E
MMIGSILITLMSTNYYGILTARIFFGLSFGTSYISSLKYCAEISSPETRVQFLFIQHFHLTLGMLLHALFQITHLSSFLMGISGMIFSLASLPFGYLKMLPSSIFLIQKHYSEEEVLERSLYFQYKNTDRVHMELEEIHKHIIDEKKRGFKFYSQHNMEALLTVVFIKFGYLSVYNIYHNYLRLIFMRSFLLEYIEVMSLTARLLGAVIGFFLLDRILKKLQFSLPAIVISILLLAFGILLSLNGFSQIWMPVAILLPVEFFLGVGVAGMSEIVKAEIFPLKERATSLSLTIFIEELIHVLMIILVYTLLLNLGSNPSLWPFVFAGTTLASGLIVLIVLKDSRKESFHHVTKLYSRNFLNKSRN